MAIETAANVDNVLGATKYSLRFLNSSNDRGSACVYQTDPDNSDPDRMSLAWFCKFSFPLTSVVFSWETNYSFVWGETGRLVPGVVFGARQTLNAQPGQLVYQRRRSHLVEKSRSRYRDVRLRHFRAAGSSRCAADL